jgi:hypothetical protein
MKEKIYLIIRLWVKTDYPDIKDAIREIEQETTLNIPSTKNVRVFETEVLKSQKPKN